MATATAEIIWLRQLLAKIGFPPRAPAHLRRDNQAAIKIASNPVYHERTKHIEVDCHSVRYHLDRKHLTFGHVSTAQQLADVLTKGLSVGRHNSLCNKLGLLRPPSLRGRIT